MTNRLLKSVQPIPDTLHFAFEYLDRGWPVIPVDGKTPATAWSAYQKELPSTKQVRRWFSSGGRKNYNLAIVTGRYSGLVVVDCDSPLRQGSYRALASTANTFARESAMDELAKKLKEQFNIKTVKIDYDTFKEKLEALNERFKPAPAPTAENEDDAIEAEEISAEEVAD